MKPKPNIENLHKNDLAFGRSYFEILKNNIYIALGK